MDGRLDINKVCTVNRTLLSTMFVYSFTIGDEKRIMESRDGELLKEFVRFDYVFDVKKKKGKEIQKVR